MPFNKMNRRQFLGSASCAAVGSASLYSTLMNLRMTNTAAAQGLPISQTSANLLAADDDYKALVCIFLAGGNDSFNMLIPSGNDEYTEYATIRADLALPQGDLLALNGTTSDGRQFGVHPSMPEVAQMFNMGDLELSARNARRQVVETKPGTPCRVSLQDAKIGENVILVHYEHQQSQDSPYKASHAIFVRECAQQAFPGQNLVPQLFRHRLMSVRAFDKNHMMIDADAVEGFELETSINCMFENSDVEYLHLHNAKPGCYAASVTRV